MFAPTPTEKLQFIADSVLRLSDFYIEQPEAGTPWSERYCQIAYRHYYLPLNYQRCKKVLQRGQELGFFEDLKNFIDWGAGPGTASLAIKEVLGVQVKKQMLFDLNKNTMQMFSDLHQSLGDKTYLDFLDLRTAYPDKKNTCLVFSYSLTEKNELPVGWKDYEALMILEPSTSQDGRKLLSLRQSLIDEGYTIWAPCTHQKSCPLLSLSKNDWCHDRVKVEAPDWFLQLEQLLPMKNKTITTSYLLARRKKPAESLALKARLTGDSMEEKGKTRQLVCRNEQREFLTWMHKSLQPQTLNRGDLITIPVDVELKSNELRLKSQI